MSALRRAAVVLVLPFVSGCTHTTLHSIHDGARLREERPTHVIPHLWIVGREGMLLEQRDGVHWRVRVRAPALSASALANGAVLLATIELERVTRVDVVDIVGRVDSLGGATDVLPWDAGRELLRVGEDAEFLALDRTLLRRVSLASLRAACGEARAVGASREPRPRIVFSGCQQLFFVDAEGAFEGLAPARVARSTVWLYEPSGAPPPALLPLLRNPALAPAE